MLDLIKLLTTLSEFQTLTMFFNHKIRKHRMSSQPEYILEQKLVEQLQSLGHKPVRICNEADLIINLKTQLEIHNKNNFPIKNLRRF